MTNIPTELLRTLIAVVDLRSFTKAAQILGVTQPAVSAQIKRLQSLLGTDLLDKSAPGVSLTATGEAVLSQARRLLSINDKIVDLTGPQHRRPTMRFGVPGDFTGPPLWRTLAEFRHRHPDVPFHMECGGSAFLFRELEQGELDLVIAVSDDEPHEQARHHWVEDMVWLRGNSINLDPAAPVPLVTRGQQCVYHRHAVAELEKAGRRYDIVFTAERINALSSIVAAGIGVTGIARSLARQMELAVWDDGVLPKLPNIVFNVCIREEAASQMLDELADAFVQLLRSDSKPAARGSALA
jgi:DNA-binding transcriptional LysR family regulator